MVNFVILLGLFGFVCGRDFSNPVITNFKNFGGVIFNNGYYYTAMKSNDSLTILNSTDLQNWEIHGPLFQDNQNPLWASYISSGKLFASKDGDFRFYFRGFNDTSAQFSIGAAFSKHPYGPYHSTDRELLWVNNANFEEPFVFEDDGKYFLYYRSQAEVWTEARILAEDGLSVVSDEIVVIQDNSYTSSYPFVMKRNDNFYLFFSACYSSGVAKGLSPLGPFEIASNPIFASENAMNAVSVVKDLDGVSDVIISQNCVTGDIHANSLLWGPDDWPYIE